MKLYAIVFLIVIVSGDHLMKDMLGIFHLLMLCKHLVLVMMTLLVLPLEVISSKPGCSYCLFLSLPVTYSHIPCKMLG
jgi:hypothetical protein